MAGSPRRTAAFALAFGYFACYAPYSAITKALTTASAAGRELTGLALLPIMTMTSAVAMIATLSALGWWRYARPAPGRWPRPNRWTFVSGLATAGIVVTTTLAYTFDGISIPFVMLLMRGGVLVIAPVVDLLAGRHIRGAAWIALGLSLLALADAVTTRTGALPWACALDVALYLTGYVVRLRTMAKLGKVDAPAVQRRYFVQEQMVATPAAVAALALLALLGPRAIAEPLRLGFAGLGSGAATAWAIAAGLASQGTGVFGGLLLLDAREATYCVPLNRAASILGGIVGSAALAVGFGLAAPSPGELVGAALLVAAIVVLWRGRDTPARALRTEPSWPPTAPVQVPTPRSSSS